MEILGSILVLLLIIFVTVILLICAIIFFVYWLLSKLFDSIEPLELSRDGTTFKTTSNNPLFRHIPSLGKKLAWEELGVFPTPIHFAYLDLENSEGRISFWMKREDLSSPLYGGNKVRALQYQIPSCQAQVAKNPDSEIFVVGTGGSNQVVATLAHGTPFSLKFHVLYPNFDAPDFDNTLNFLSTLSFGPLSLKIWDQFLPQLKRLLPALTSKDDKVFGLGGNSIGGILGQMGGALELAEQIEGGIIPDIDEIYLPMGSSCTTSGLILGVCFARHLKLNAFRSHRFKIVSICVHGGLAALNRKTNYMKNKIGKYLSICPQFGISRAVPYFKKLTGIDLGPAALKFLDQEWEIVDGAEYSWPYGAHSERSAVASALDHKLIVSGPCPNWITPGSLPPLPWLCGHFSGKAFAYMLDRMQERKKGGDAHEVKVLLWQTKSNIQPLGNCEEWIPFQKMTKESKVLKTWADEGKDAVSVLRPGKIDPETGTPSDYRPIMKKVVG